MKKLLFLIVLIAGTLFFQSAIDFGSVQHAPTQTFTGLQQCIIFTQPELDTFFTRVTLPKIKKLCEKKNIELIIKNTQEGTPEGITSTPCLVYQNALGRSIYAARYMEFSTIENFIRSSRVVPQQQISMEKRDVLIYTKGKMKIVIALKITDISSEKNNTINQELFKNDAKKYIDAAMQRFDNQELVSLLKTDRVFYLDIHPYLDAKQNLFLSYEIYSQFSCITPILSTLKTPMQGSFSEQEKLFSTLGKAMESEILQQLNNSKIGDAVNALDKNTPIKTWDQLAISLPKDDNFTAKKDFPKTALPKNWTYMGAIDNDVPVLQFRFMEPLDRYVGEVKKLNGTLQLNENQALTSGNFEVETNSLTMGIDDFDAKIHKKYIHVKQFPKASFKFLNLQNQPALQWGKTTSSEAYGEFLMVGKKKNITVQTQLTPTLGNNNEVLLLVQCNFQVNITDDFGIAGPDGPDPAKKILNFNMNFYMKS
jgi:polyisoprenoid-binding protein YceI